MTATDDNNVTKGKVLEDTLLMLVNENPEANLIATVGVLDGHQTPVALFLTHLSPLDLDEINICRTLELNGIVPPEAGVLEIVSFEADGVTPEGGVYAWVKDLVVKGADEWKRPAVPAIPLPRKLAGDSTVISVANTRKLTATIFPKVLGIGKTECRSTPPEVYENTQGVSVSAPLSDVSKVLDKIHPTGDVPPYS